MVRRLADRWPHDDEVEAAIVVVCAWFASRADELRQSAGIIELSRGKEPTWSK